MNDYLKSLKDKKEKSKQELKALYRVDKDMGYSKGYTEWLETRYIELEENFDQVNKQRIQLIEEKYRK